MRIRRLSQVLVTPIAAVLIATCSPGHARVAVRAPQPPTTTTTTIDKVLVKRWYEIAYVQNVVALNDAVRKNAEAVRHEAVHRAQQPASVASGTDRGPAVSAPPDIASIMACIRAHESGDYTIHNHGYSGSSGAYQYLRGTWLAWSARAGYGDYDAAFLAPPSVQDAVTAFTLTHGGAHNWDPSYGDDPCTVNLP